MRYVLSLFLPVHPRPFLQWCLWHYLNMWSMLHLLCHGLLYWCAHLTCYSPFFVLSVLILSPSFDEMASSFEVFACIWEWVWDKSAKSSAKSRSSSWSTRVHCMPFLESDVVSFIAQSMARRKRNGDKRHPCLTPVLILNFSVKPLLCKMRQLVLCAFS